jgi:hypothetical protein
VIAGARAALDTIPPWRVAVRCAVVAGDFFDEVPAGADLYLLSRVLHDWDDAAAMRILHSCRRAMSDSSVLVVADAILPERARDQPAAIRMDLHMLTLVNGQERTLDEFKRLFAAAGLRLQRVVLGGGATGINALEARPA